MVEKCQRGFRGNGKNGGLIVTKSKDRIEESQNERFLFKIKSAPCGNETRDKEGIEPANCLLSNGKIK
jgi:hypothetical protein